MDGARPPPSNLTGKLPPRTWTRSDVQSSLELRERGSPGGEGDPPKQACSGVGRRNRHGKDARGYYHRKISPSGNLKLAGISYYVGMDLGGREVLVRDAGTALHLHAPDETLLRKIPKRTGRRY